MLPKDVEMALWSYDKTKINPKKHKKTIISQVLNWGNKKATDWLFGYYGMQEVTRIAQQIPLGQWDKKSLALWSIVLGIKPNKRRERIA